MRTPSTDDKVHGILSLPSALLWHGRGWALGSSSLCSAASCPLPVVRSGVVLFPLYIFLYVLGTFGPLRFELRTSSRLLVLIWSVLDFAESVQTTQLNVTTFSWIAPGLYVLPSCQRPLLRSEGAPAPQTSELSRPSHEPCARGPQSSGPHLSRFQASLLSPDGPQPACSPSSLPVPPDT